MLAASVVVVLGLWPVAGWLMSPSRVDAQFTGGSFGGGGFGGGSSAGSSGSGYSGSSYSGSGSSRPSPGVWRSTPSISSPRSSVTPTSSSTPSYGPTQEVKLRAFSSYDRSTRNRLIFLFLLGLCLAAYLARRLFTGRRIARIPFFQAVPEHIVGVPAAGSPVWSRMDITALSLALDARSRVALQQKLAALARSGSTGTRRGLAKLCRETAELLSSMHAGWIYGGAKNYTPMSPPQAEQGFRRLASDYRSRYRHEAVRAEGGQLREGAAGDVRAGDDEGDGVVVVTLIVAARYELLDLNDPCDKAELRLALRALSAMQAKQLVAIEVIWSPAEDEDRMSSAELETLYPELGKLDDSLAMGRVRCSSCSAPYAMELGRCPRCGTPNSALA